MKPCSPSSVLAALISIRADLDEINPEIAENLAGVIESIKSLLFPPDTPLCRK